jgi:hypothetical protein
MAAALVTKISGRGLSNRRRLLVDRYDNNRPHSARFCPTTAISLERVASATLKEMNEKPKKEEENGRRRPKATQSTR